MRGHIIGLSRLLSIAVMAMLVVFMAWNLTSAPQPGEAIPDSIATTLRGGCNGRYAATCYPNMDPTLTCNSGSKTVVCDAKSGGIWDVKNPGFFQRSTDPSFCCGAQDRMSCIAYAQGTVYCSTTSP